MTRDELLDALCAAPPGQFDHVVAKLGVPTAHLSSPQAAQATRAGELLRWAERQGRLADLERALRLTAGADKRPRSPLRSLAIGVLLTIVGALAVVGWILHQRRPPVVVPLLWAPSDCRNKEPLIGYGSCGELRDLPWLQSHLNGLSSGRVHGFDGLGLDPRVFSVSYRGKENWLLYIEPRGGGRFVIGVGYDRDTGGKDGCLHLYDTRNRRFRAATACMDKDGSWWASDGWLGTFRRVHAY